MSDHRKEAHRVLRLEVLTIHNLMASLDESFDEAVELILKCKSKVIVTGMGKSGLMGRKISSTLSSTGTPSLFLHPAESSHGDLGVVRKGDLIIAISNSGEAYEMVPLINYLSRKGIPFIAMTAQLDSTLAQAATLCLDISTRQEACPLGLAPTSSSIATCALGDALAMAVLKARGFDEQSFAEYHPGGALGRKLLTRVSDVMHTSLPLVRKEEKMSQVISLMTNKEVRGVIGVVDEDQNLIGVVTDGDIRRQLEKNSPILHRTVKDLMSTTPKVVQAQELAAKAHFMMTQYKIQVLFVVDKSKIPVGLVHIHDVLKII